MASASRCHQHERVVRRGPGRDPRDVRRADAGAARCGTGSPARRPRPRARGRSATARGGGRGRGAGIAADAAPGVGTVGDGRRRRDRACPSPARRRPATGGAAPREPPPPKPMPNPMPTPSTSTMAMIAGSSQAGRARTRPPRPRPGARRCAGAGGAGRSRGLGRLTAALYPRKRNAPSGRADGACEESRQDGGPDRIRTGDLQRDRLACWAATPRVRDRWRIISGTPGGRQRVSASASAGADGPSRRCDPGVTGSIVTQSHRCPPRSGARRAGVREIPTVFLTLGPIAGTEVNG